MAPPPFWRKLTDAQRSDLDDEIRLRAYGDLHGLADWLSERGITISKSPVGEYVKRLKRLDNSLTGTQFDSEVTALALKFAAFAVKTALCFKKLQKTIDERDSPT